MVRILLVSEYFLLRLYSEYGLKCLSQCSHYTAFQIFFIYLMLEKKKYTYSGSVFDRKSMHNGILLKYTNNARGPPRRYRFFFFFFYSLFRDSREKFLF